MFTIGLDTSAVHQDFKSHALRGTGRYVHELNRYFANNASDRVSVTSFSHNDLLSNSVANSVINSFPLGKVTLRQQLLYPWKLRGAETRNMDALHFPAHIDAPSWSVKRYVVTVLDLIPVIFDELYRNGRMGWRFRLARWLELQAIRSASLVLAISDNTARDVNRILGVPFDRIAVTPLGVDEDFFQRSEPEALLELREKLKIPFDRETILYVGGIDQRKNMPVLIQAFGQVCQKYRIANRTTPMLIMAGGIDSDLEYPKLLRLISSSNLNDDVIFTGYVPDAELKKLYQMSSVLFFPSLYEGFGLTPLEAMASGTPVVSSNTSAMPEVLGDAAVLFDPSDAAQASEVLLQVLEDQELAEELSDKGLKQATKFSWSATGEKTLAAYEKLLLNQ